MSNKKPEPEPEAREYKDLAVINAKSSLFQSIKEKRFWRLSDEEINLMSSVFSDTKLLSHYERLCLATELDKVEIKDTLSHGYIFFLNKAVSYFKTYHVMTNEGKVISFNDVYNNQISYIKEIRNIPDITSITEEQLNSIIAKYDFYAMLPEVFIEKISDDGIDITQLSVYLYDFIISLYNRSAVNSREYRHIGQKSEEKFLEAINEFDFSSLQDRAMVNFLIEILENRINSKSIRYILLNKITTIDISEYLSEEREKLLDLLRPEKSEYYILFRKIWVGNTVFTDLPTSAHSLLVYFFSAAYDKDRVIEGQLEPYEIGTNQNAILDLLGSKSKFSALTSKQIDFLVLLMGKLYDQPASVQVAERVLNLFESPIRISTLIGEKELIEFLQFFLRSTRLFVQIIEKIDFEDIVTNIDVLKNDDSTKYLMFLLNSLIRHGKYSFSSIASHNNSNTIAFFSFCMEDDNISIQDIYEVILNSDNFPRFGSMSKVEVYFWNKMLDFDESEKKLAEKIILNFLTVFKDDPSNNINGFTKEDIAILKRCKDGLRIKYPKKFDSESF